jgi:hypothetical protein
MFWCSTDDGVPSSCRPPVVFGPMPENNGWSVEPGLDGGPACSDWARSQHLDPVGSAGSYEGFLLVEQPLPWPFDVSSIPDLIEVARLAASAHLRLQAVIPASRQEASRQTMRVEADEVENGGLENGGLENGGLEGDGVEGDWVEEAARPAGVEVARRSTGEGRRSTGEVRRVICYRSARPGWAGPLVRSERLAAAGALAEATGALLSQGPAPDQPEPITSRVVDVLVCTHGRRDACCGSRGIDLVGGLKRDSQFGSEAGVRLWRTSHTGGHRFAPTAVLLPAGTMWAWVTPALLRAAAFTEGEVGPWLERYRGCATVGSPAQQAAERAVLGEVGWPLVSSYRRAWDVGDGLVRLETEREGTWEAAVREGRRVPQPDCRTSPELATKQSVEWMVEGLRQVVPA